MLKAIGGCMLLVLVYGASDKCAEWDSIQSFTISAEYPMQNMTFHLAQALTWQSYTIAT
jgi:hypothetical protein